MPKVSCDLPKSKGGINYVDLIALAEKRGIAVPQKILKRDLCTLVNDANAATFYALSSAHKTIKSTKLKEPTIDLTKDNESLPQLTSLYTIKKVLGEGSFGKVLRAVDKKTGEEVALKLLHSLTDSSKREVAILINVSKIYQNACYNNILCYKDQFAALYKENESERRFEIIVTQFINGTSLDKRIEQKKAPFPTFIVKKWSRQLFAALNLCHANGISHMDVKPANVMIRDDNNDLVLIDFGISCNENSTSEKADNCRNQGGGTLLYMSPDYLKHCVFPIGITKGCNESIRQNTDYWAAALTILDAATYNRYLYSIAEIGKNTKFLSYDGEENKAYGDEFIAQLKQFISNNPPSTEDATLNKQLQLNLNKGGL